MSRRVLRAAWAAGLATGSVVVGVLTAAPAGAVVGDSAKDGQYAFSARIDIDGRRSCTGALVDQSWVLTAAACFADDPAQGRRIPGGRPQQKTTVTVGRTDLTGQDGATVEAVELSPRGDRDLVMVRLAKPVTNVTPVTVATAAPRQGEELRVTGYGRTKDEWAPDLLHTATFGVGAVSATAFDMAGTAPADAALCKGDHGGPAFREKNGAVELVAVNTASWEGGCWGSDEAETRRGAVATRVDDVNSWIQQRRLSHKITELTDVTASADFNGDGRTDLAAVLRDGSLHVFYAGPDGTLEYGRELWYDKTWGGKNQIIGGDFNGDGLTDIAAVNSDGQLHLYAGQPGGKLATAKKMWTDASFGKMPNIARFRADGWKRDGLITIWGDKSLYAYPTGADGVLTGQKREMWRDKTWVKREIATGDFNGDGHDDIAAVATDGGLHLYAGNGRGSFDDARSLWRDKSWDTMQFVHAGDFDGDGKADLVARWKPTLTSVGSVYLYAGDGKGALADSRSMWPASSEPSRAAR